MASRATRSKEKSKNLEDGKILNYVYEHPNRSSKPLYWVHCRQRIKSTKKPEEIKERFEALAPELYRMGYHFEKKLKMHQKMKIVLNPEYLKQLEGKAKIEIDGAGCLKSYEIVEKPRTPPTRASPRLSSLSEARQRNAALKEREKRLLASKEREKRLEMRKRSAPAPAPDSETSDDEMDTELSIGVTSRTETSRRAVAFETDFDNHSHSQPSSSGSSQPARPNATTPVHQKPSNPKPPALQTTPSVKIEFVGLVPLDLDIRRLVPQTSTPGSSAKKSSNQLTLSEALTEQEANKKKPSSTQNPRVKVEDVQGSSNQPIALNATIRQEPAQPALPRTQHDTGLNATIRQEPPPSPIRQQSRQNPAEVQGSPIRSMCAPIKMERSEGPEPRIEAPAAPQYNPGIKEEPQYYLEDVEPIVNAGAPEYAAPDPAPIAPVQPAIKQEPMEVDEEISVTYAHFEPIAPQPQQQPQPQPIPERVADQGHIAREVAAAVATAMQEIQATNAQMMKDIFAEMMRASRRE